MKKVKKSASVLNKTLKQYSPEGFKCLTVSKKKKVESASKVGRPRLLKLIKEWGIDEFSGMAGISKSTAIKLSRTDAKISDRMAYAISSVPEFKLTFRSVVGMNKKNVADDGVAFQSITTPKGKIKNAPLSKKKKPKAKK